MKKILTLIIVFGSFFLHTQLVLATTEPNLIQNPSVERVSTVDVNIPDGWGSDYWGTNTSNFSYPVPGFESDKAVMVSVDSYTDGDAKWYFNDIKVVPAASYAFSDMYKSSVSTSVIIRYTMNDGSFLYVDLPDAPASAAWKEYTGSFIVPAGAVSATVFHLLANVGTLTVDDYALTEAGVTGGVGGDHELFPKGMVTLSFDDGWLSHYTNALPILNGAGLKGVFGIITDEAIGAVSENLIANPSQETGEGRMPDGWNVVKKGTNNAISAYPVAGQDGVRAVRISISNYKSGEARLYFDGVGVMPDQDYSYEEYYKADVPTTVTLLMYLTNGKTRMVDLDNVKAANTWTKYSKTFHLPKDIDALTVMHRLKSAGSLTVDNTDLMRVQIYADLDMLREMEADGHEIASHSQTHPSLTSISQAAMLKEINGSKSDLLNNGIHIVDTFVYPYGDHNADTELTVKNAGYIGARSDMKGYNTRSTDRYALKIQEVGASDTPAQIQQYIDTAVANKTWLILMYHEIKEGGDELSTTPQILKANVDYLKNNNIPVVTLSQGLEMMEQ